VDSPPGPNKAKSRRAIELAFVAAQQSEFEAKDVFAAGLFPVCAATHDLGIRRLFDLATLLLLLDCRPGDTVLDLGAGPGFSSEMLARLGYDVVALDPDHPALQANRQRPRWDRERIEGTVRVTQGMAEQLPFHDAAFDGVLGMNVLHHVPDLAGVIAELARVLKPGCRAVFAEPGLDHLEADETKRAIREHGEDDRAFDVLGFLKTARANRFQDAMLTATLQPPLRLLPIEEVDLYLSGEHPRAYLTPKGVIDELHRRHPYAMLVRDGVRPKTSRHPGLLRRELRVDDVPASVTQGTAVDVTVHALNTGDTVWSAKPSRLGGFVTVGCKLLAADGRLISDTIGRTFLPKDVNPGDDTWIHISLEFPNDLPAGHYSLQFDLVNELICWFADVSSEAPVARAIAVVG
jgi:SAM-dependent methyltransferase